LGELVHSVVVEQLSEHELICGSEPAWELGEGEAVAEQQPPRASSCEAVTSLRGRRLRVVKALLPEKRPAPYLPRQCRNGFATLPPKLLQDQPVVFLLWGRYLASWLLAIDEHSELEDLRGSSRRSVIPYVHEN
jgi:hypothetical protein